MVSPRPLLMGVLNVTPDSFSDGGQFLSIEAALKQGRRLRTEGADLIDVGGESTRPGAAAVDSAEELRRVLPVVEALAADGVSVSIDTSKPEVARAAVRAGAQWINDVTGCRQPEMARTVADTGAGVILMHMQGDPRTMQANPTYPKGVVEEVHGWLADRVRALGELGVGHERLWVDPGIGFGKTLEQNLLLLRNLSRFRDLGSRLLIGTSRKSFLSRVLGSESIAMVDREAGTLASNLWAYSQGASVFRVHDVGAFRRALTTWEAIHGGL